jgi:DNA-binding transcriptional LysR family regulator
MTILDELDRARSEARGRVALLSGDIAIGLPPTVADVLASALAVRIIKQYPQVKLRILSSYSGYILDALQRGGVDIAILYHGPAERTVKARPLLTERLMAIGPAGRLAAGEAGIAFETLTRQPLILPSRRHGLRLLLDAAAARMGQELVPIVETDSLGVQIDLVRRGLGFTVLPLVAAFADVQAGRLSAAPIVDPPLERRLTVALPSDRPVSPGAAQLEHLVREEVARLVEGGGWSAQLAGG